MWIALISSLTEATDQAFRWQERWLKTGQPFARIVCSKTDSNNVPSCSSLPHPLLWRRKDFLIVVVLLLYVIKLVQLLQYILVCSFFNENKVKQTKFQEKENKNFVISAHKSTPYALISKNTLHLNKRIFKYVVILKVKCILP